MDDIFKDATPEDISLMKSELGESGKKPDADSSPAEKTVETASKESESNATVAKDSEKQKESPVKEKTSEDTTSEGDKTLSTQEVTPKVRQKKFSKTVPYERFKEVNDKLKEALEKTPETHSDSLPNPPQELDEFGRQFPTQESWDKKLSNEVTKKVQEVLEPVVTTLDKQIDEAEYEKVMESHPEAKNFEKEIRAYAEATNLTYEDIVSLVKAKHSTPVSNEEKEKVKSEAQEAELSGKSNSAARREKPAIHKMSDKELEEAVEGYTFD